MSKNTLWLKKIPFAHRGLHNEIFPENSIVSFENAIKYEYGIELDVRFTKDKKVVVFHDDNLKRMTGNTNNIIDLNYEEIKKLRLLNSNEKIPLLQDVLKIVNSKTPILIEIKESIEYKEISEAVYQIVKPYKGMYAIQSFDIRIVSWYKKNANQIIRGQICSNYTDILFKWYQKLIPKHVLLNFKTKPDYICHGLKSIDNKQITSLRKKMPIVCWTIKNKEDMQKAYKYSDNIIFEGIIPKINKKG